MSKPITLGKPAASPVSAMPTTPPAGPDRIASLPWKSSRRRQAARRHHEHQPRAGARDVEFLRHLPDIAPQDRREIGVDDRRVAAAHELDQRRDLVADRDLREAHGAGDRSRPLLVVGEAPGMHEDDGDRLEALRFQPLECGAQFRLFQLLLHRAVGQHPLADLRNLGIEQLGLHDVWRRSSAAPGSRSPARLGSRASSPARSDRPCARGARWWRPSCPSAPRR